MKQFFTKLISSSSELSSKRALMIFFSVILAVICLYAAYKEQFVIAIPALVGLILTLGGYNSSENKRQIEADKPKEKEEVK